jgi:hypothetical protein
MGGEWTLDGRFIKRQIVNGRKGSKWERSSSSKKAVFKSKEMWRDV